MHGARDCSEVGEAAEGETPIFTYAMDGYSIHSPLDTSTEAGAEAEADLDECNGHETDELGYHCHANPAEENSVLTCFTGVTVEGQGGGDGGPSGGGPGGPGGGPDFSDATEQLGVTEEALSAALGEPPFDLDAAAEELGVSAEALEEALPTPPGGQ